MGTQGIDRLEELRRVHDEIGRLKERESKLSQPLVANVEVIRNLFDVFTLTLKRQDPAASPRDTNSRKKFLYAILYIFSPATLVGEVMRHKLREYVSSVIGCTPTGVSRDYKTSLFFFATYKDFREDVNAVINDMIEVVV